MSNHVNVRVVGKHSNLSPKGPSRHAGDENDIPHSIAFLRECGKRAKCEFIIPANNSKKERCSKNIFCYSNNLHRHASKFNPNSTFLVHTQTAPSAMVCLLEKGTYNLHFNGKNII